MVSDVEQNVSSSLGRFRRLCLHISATVGHLHTVSPRMADDDECEAVGGMGFGRGNRGTQRKPAPLALCPPKIPHDLAWAGTWDTEV
jgi:hypothetical protein